MKRKRYTQEQIAFALRQAEAGTAVEAICRKFGIAEQTFYRWKKQFAGMGVAEIRRLRELEAENTRLKKLVADLTLDRPCCRRSSAERGEARRAPPGRRPSAGGLWHQRAAGLSRLRVPQRYRSRRDPATELRMRLKELAATRVRYGYRRLHVLLRREGWLVNAKRVYRLHREEGLSIRPKTPRRRRACRYRSGRSAIDQRNDCRAMDFMADQPFDGRPFRILTVVDCHAREALAVVPRVNFRAD